MSKKGSRHRRASQPDWADRVGTGEFLRITRLGRTTFFTRYRSDPIWQDRFDIRVDALTGYLHMSRSAAEQFAAERHGERGRSPHADRLGDHARPSVSDEDRLQEDATGAAPFGVRLAALARALADGAISREQFERAVTDLEQES